MCGNNIKRPVSSSKAPAAVGPYSHAYQAGDFFITSGQLGLVPDSGKMIEGGVAAEAKQALDNLGAVLNAAGLDYHHVIKTTVFVTNMADFAQVNSIYADYFVSNPPARSCVQVAALPMGAAFEVEAIAYDDHSSYYMGGHTHSHTHNDSTTHNHDHDHSHPHSHDHGHEHGHSHD